MHSVTRTDKGKGVRDVNGIRCNGASLKTHRSPSESSDVAVFTQLLTFNCGSSKGIMELSHSRFHCAWIEPENE